MRVFKPYRTSRRAASFALALGLLSAADGAQDTAFRVDADLVTVTFSVEKNGRLLKALTADDIDVLENGKPQRIALLTPLLSASTSVELVLLVDTSTSVLDDSGTQLEPLVRDVVRTMAPVPGTRVTLFAFNRELIRFTGPVVTATDAEKAASCLCRTSSAADPYCASNRVRIPLRLPARQAADRRGASWIFESIIGALQSLGKAPPDWRRLLVVVSDGVASTTTGPAMAAGAAHELGIPIYPVAVGREQRMRRGEVLSQAPPGIGGPLIAQAGAIDGQTMRFALLGEMTGGRSYDLRAAGPDVHEEIVRSVLLHATNQFVVGYVPASHGAMVRRKVEVRLRSKVLGSVRGGRRTFVH